VSSYRAMEKSFLHKYPSHQQTIIQASYYAEGNKIFLSLFPSVQEDLRRFLFKKAVAEPVLFYTLVDRRADSCLVWAPLSDRPVLIGPESSKALRKTGAFLAVVPEQKQNEIRIIEDGYVLSLNTTTWQKLRDAFVSGGDVTLSGEKEEEVSISIEWVK